MLGFFFSGGELEAGMKQLHRAVLSGRALYIRGADKLSANRAVAAVELGAPNSIKYVGPYLN